MRRRHDLSRSSLREFLIRSNTWLTTHAAASSTTTLVDATVAAMESMSITRRESLLFSLPLPRLSLFFSVNPETWNQSRPREVVIVALAVTTVGDITSILLAKP
ncbi:hypothetical protein P5V15_002444 [Pogonomyrmex californicus]